MTRARLLIAVSLLIVALVPSVASARHGRGHGRGWHPHRHHHHGFHHYGPRVFIGGVWGPFYPPYYPYYAPYPVYAYPPPPPEEPGWDAPPEEAPPGKEPGAERAPETGEEVASASYGLVQLRGVPDGTAIDLDGRYWLSAADLDERWLALPQGPHTLAVKLPGAEPVVRRIQVEAGKSQVVRFGPLPPPPA